MNDTDPDDRDRAAFVASCADALEFGGLHSVIASISAARLHRLWLPPWVAQQPVHLAAATPARAGRAMSRTRRPSLIAHRFQLMPEDVVLVDGLPSTSLECTWLHLAAVLEVPDLVAAGDCALRSGTSVEQLRAVLDRFPARAGGARARVALTMVDARSRSRPESHLRVAVHGVSRVPFEVNAPVYRGEGGWLAEPDLSLAAAKIALEYQGSDHAELVRMRKDLTRWKDLRDDRWLVLPYGPAEVFDRPWQVRVEVRTNVAERAPELAVRRVTRGGGRSRPVVVTTS